MRLAKSRCVKPAAARAFLICPACNSQGFVVIMGDIFISLSCAPFFRRACSKCPPMSRAKRRVSLKVGGYGIVWPRRRKSPQDRLRLRDDMSPRIIGMRRGS